MSSTYQGTIKTLKESHLAPRTRARTLLLLPAADHMGACSAWITWCRRRGRGEIPTATWSLAASNAIRGRACLAEDYIRQLYRERCLTPSELADRIRALDALTNGKLRPQLPAPFPSAASSSRGSVRAA